MPGTGEDDQVAVADDHLHDRARVRRQDLVAVAVQQQQGSGAERRAVLAAGGLGRERDDSRAVLAEDDPDLERDGTAERVADGDEARRAGARGEIRGGRHVEHAAGQVVRLAVADPDRADALRGEFLAEVVVEPAGRAEQPTHAAATHHHDVLGLRVAVPEQRQQPLQRVDLEVVDVRRDLHVFGGERLEQLEG